MRNVIAAVTFAAAVCVGGATMCGAQDCPTDEWVRQYFRARPFNCKWGTGRDPNSIFATCSREYWPKNDILMVRYPTDSEGNTHYDILDRVHCAPEDVVCDSFGPYAVVTCGCVDHRATCGIGWVIEGFGEP